MPEQPAEKPTPKHSRDDRLVIPMDPEEAVKRLLEADPKAIPPERGNLVPRPKWLDDQTRDQVVTIFRNWGVDAPVYVAREVDPTEAVFVVGPVARLPQTDLVKELTSLFGRKLKVGVTTMGQAWEKAGLLRLDA